MISKKNEKLDKLNKENGSLRKQISLLKKENPKALQEKKKISNTDHQTKKSRSRKKKKRSIITEVPILIDNQKTQNKAKPRDIFFYNIPKYWKEKDIVKELSKIGKVYRVQIKKQYKYLSVRALVLLYKQFESSFISRAFGMGINKHFVRWYSGESTIKERKERDQWQLIRNLTAEEMEECKEDEYKFLKKIKGEDKIAAIKALKLGKV
jgi:hypothetical protein